jgi:choline kinase/thiamine kinase-like enzyme
MKTIKTTVVIPTAGTGSRMGNYTKNLNKALLPYKNKPVISHIIDSFPTNTKFIIPVGYLADQIKDFCRIAYADRDIEFIQVDDYLSPESGTSYTLRQCRDKVNGSFWYVPCDTYFNESVVDRVTDENCYFVKSVPEKDTHLYTMFDIDNYSKITKITFKKSTTESSVAFTGLVYIHHYNDFFDSLEELNSNELIYSIQLGDKVDKLNTWLDFGDPVNYQTELSKSQKFDFTKKDELTYICNKRVVKWWIDSSTPKKKYVKTLENPLVFPPNCQHVGNFMAYDYFEGKTLYEYNNPDSFKSCLTWLKDEVWLPVDADITSASIEFYKNKTLARVNKFLEKYPNLKKVNFIDGVKVNDYTYYLNKIDWDYLSTTTLPGFIHGDLQFDNVVINNEGKFKVIDWRHEFANIVEYGDIYYDLAKLAGGFIINYANIKEHNFNIEIDNDTVTLSIPNIDQVNVYQRQLKEFIISRGYDYKKVQMLIPIIYWNMSPLHTAPFDLFLWYLSIKLMSEL